MNEIKLVYTGHGFVPGIPARDLTGEEVEQYGGEKYLIETGQYSKPKKTSKDKT